MTADVTTTLITSCSAVVVAVIGAWSGRGLIRLKKRRRQETVAANERAAVARYEADPGLFVKDLMEQNRLLGLRMTAQEKRAAAQDERLSVQEQRMASVLQTLAAVTRAFRDYIRRVHRSWGKPGGPPQVSAEIRALLEESDLDDTFNPDAESGF